MSISRRTVAATVVALAAVGGAGVAVATATSPAVDAHAETGDGDGGSADAAEDAVEGEDRPIDDADALDRASRAALDWLATEHGATGTVTATEVGDEESYYEIEVTLKDGRQVDVQLTEDYSVVGLD